MSCELCQNDPGIYPVRVDAADVDIYGCRRHAGAVVRSFLLGRRVDAELDSVRGRLALWAASDRIATTAQLAAVLGGSDDSFTGRILDLLAKADPGNRIRLRLVYPDLVIAWLAWQACDPAPTPGELWRQIQAYAEREITESAAQHGVYYVPPADPPAAVSAVQQGTVDLRERGNR